MLERLKRAAKLTSNANKDKSKERSKQRKERIEIKFKFIGKRAKFYSSSIRYLNNTKKSFLQAE